MRVYGKLQYQQPLSELLEHLRVRLAEMDPGSVDHWRGLLIEAGQIEQAVTDSQHRRSDQRLVNWVATLTDRIAAGFLQSWEAPGQSLVDQKEHLTRFISRAKWIPAAGERDLTVRIPEGFAFYALFPEQYCAAARVWAAQRGDLRSRRVTVVGIRSIGTSLSAAILATLKSLKLDAGRMTVRLDGPPFERRVRIKLPGKRERTCAVVVDEGPGISGSSMAATAQGLERAGIRDITFFPGHSGRPGAAATREIRRCWERIPRHTFAAAGLKWKDRSLTEVLAREARRLWAGARAFKTVDVSAGEWRRFAGFDDDSWPPVAEQFERMKFLCVDRAGNKVLWKFAGFGSAARQRSISERMLERVSRLAHLRLTPEPLGTFRGFLATRWIDGKRLTRSDARDPEILRHIGRYIAASAEGPLSAEDNHASISRLEEMLYWNTKDALGDSAAKAALRCARLAPDNGAAVRYGDGRLAPHEWVRTPDGCIWKTDGEGHDCDHTLVGEQSVLWDIAGAFVEWDLDDGTAGPLLDGIRRMNIEVPGDGGALTFYRMAYAAFRLGFYSLAAGQTGIGAERERLVRASGFHRDQLAKLIAREPRRFRSHRGAHSGKGRGRPNR